MLINKALELHRAGRITEAAEIYSQLLTESPNNADFLFLSGSAMMQLDDIDSAILLISKASALFPQNESYLISLGLAYTANKQVDRAMTCYHDVLKINPSSSSAYFSLGNLFQKQNRLEEAINYFTLALKLNPNFTEARYNLANIEKSFGNYTEAIDHYQKIVVSKPNFADAYHNMGSAFYALGQLDDALASYQQALWCNLPETHNNIGIIFFDKGQFDQALSCYQQAIEINPEYAEAYNNIGSCFRKLGEFKQAEAAFNKAIEITPNYAIAHLNLGDLLLEHDVVKEAASHYEQVILIDPWKAEAYFNLGLVRNKQNDLLSACMYFEHALACRPNYIDAIYNLGVVNGRLMRLNEAERHYRQAIELDPCHVNAHINLSALLMEDGRTLEAKNHIDLAYSQKNVFEKYSPFANKTILILFDVGKGNLNLSHLINEKTNNIIDWMIEYASDDQADKLPPYDLVFNAMGDPDQTGDTRQAVSRFLKVCTKPLLNHPDKVARTARNALPTLLEGIENLLVPTVWRFASNTDWDETVMGSHLPLLIRPVHTQGGIGLMLANTLAELADYKTHQSGPVYISRFIDFRSADLWFRKYRIIFIDRKPYPYHLAISQNWMVHYYTAEMESHPWKFEEELKFLQYPESVLGSTGMNAIRAIGQKMDLDYAGIDFSIMADGRLLVFEANPSMLVHPEKAQGAFEQKNAYVYPILNAFEDLLCKTKAN